MIVFDIETGPLPLNILKSRMPEFDPEDVKCGNLKDAAKIADKIAAAKRSHEEKYIERAALSATTGRVLAIGIGKRVLSCDGDEGKMLTTFWSMFANAVDACESLVGFNIFAFDLPFLVRRSWRCEVDVPTNVIERGRYWHHSFVDLLDVWRLGNRQEYISLDRLATSLGLAGKPDDGTTGADFARLWQEDRQKAIGYLRNDIRMTAEVATALQIV